VCCAGEQKPETYQSGDYMMILGIDIAKEKFDVALFSEKKLLSSGTFRNDFTGYKKLHRWLEKKTDQRVWGCMEATGRYGEGLASYLFETGYKISVVNPARIRKYADSKLLRNKTDLLDAKVIADFCRTQEPGLWQPEKPEKCELREISRRLSALLEERTRENNRLQSGIKSKVVKESIEENLAFLGEQIISLEENMQDHIDQNPDLKEKQELLISIPGVGKKTATLILGELPSVDRFQHSGQVVAYAGLSPQQRSSGSSVKKKTRLTKIGNRNLKTGLYFPAMTAMKHNPLVFALALRLEKRGKEKMVIIGAAMKKLLQLSYGVLKSRMPFDPNYAVSPQISA
jgi:transposase